ncbi:MAG: thiamine phosphate synthase [Gammaproteobacteria bacterium]|nr:thiamine phosphate synthase [Gammaproteobacteria bacterium]
MHRLTPGLYVITEDQDLEFDELLVKTQTILGCNVSALQYRKKNSPYSQRVSEASELKELCRDYKTKFIINDDIELAMEINSDGIHLGEDDITCQQARTMLGDEKIIGISCYNDLNRAKQAYEESADYLAFGAMYATTTKQKTKKASPELLVTAKQHFPVPLVAIGGITPENCQPLLASGADLLAVVNCVYHAKFPDKVIANFYKQIKDNHELI